jgi:hypothetical protein
LCGGTYGIIAVVPTSLGPKTLVVAIVAVPSPELLAEDRRWLLVYIVESLDLDKVLCLALGTLDQFLACLGIAEPAFEGYFLNGEVAEVVEEVTVECEATAEIREVHSLDMHATEMVGLEKAATSGFVVHIHNHLLLDQQISQQIHPFDPVS